MGTSPPGPLSLSGEGVCIILYELAQQALQSFAAHLRIPNANHSIAPRLEECGPCDIDARLSRLSVNSAIQLQNQAQARAIEIHDETTQDVLAPELQAEDAALSQQRPRQPLSRCRIAS